MSAFFRFPHTPHLAWLGEGQPRDDKVLLEHEARELLAGAVVLEEKVDGANLGFSTDPEGHLRAQNRGTYLKPEHAHRQFRPLWAWLEGRRERLVDALWPNLMLFGEWCVAVHSVHYDRLPDWFVGFDVYDRDAGAFWSTARRDALLADLGLHAAPSLGRGHYTLEELPGLLGTSRVGSEPMEGLVVRLEQDDQTVARAKLVRPEFTQAIDAHWSKGPLRGNRLASGVAIWG